MKRKFILSEEVDRYVLRDNNPNRKEQPFAIDKNELKFDTSVFYEYVFGDIDVDSSIEIETALKNDDKKGSIIYKTIDEIAHGVMNKISESKCKK